MEYLAAEQHDEEFSRRKLRKARAALATLLQRLRRSSETLDELSKWNDLAADVEALVRVHSDAIPLEEQRQLRQAPVLPQATLTAVRQACKILQLEVEKVISGVALGPAVGTAALAGLIVVVSVAIVTLAANVAAVEVEFDRLAEKRRR